MPDWNSLFVIDGNSILNRAFYGVKPLTTSDGRPTNAIYGFLNMVLRQLELTRPGYAAIAFDLSQPTFRHTEYADYKAGRKGMPDELFAQLDPVKRISDALGLHVLTCEGFEADDILGTCAALSCADVPCFLFTGDRDAFQLVSDTCTVLYASTKETQTFDLKHLLEVYGVAPKQLIEVKALMGDASDHIPGVAGIGEKTALKLIGEYGTVDNLYDHLETANIAAGVKAKLLSGKADALMSRRLAEICTSVPLNLTCSSLAYLGLDLDALLALCREFELKSLPDRLERTSLPRQQRANGETPLSECGKMPETPSPVVIPSDTPPDLPEKRLGVHWDLAGNCLYLAPLRQQGQPPNVYCIPATRENCAAVFESTSFSTLLYHSKETERCLIDLGLSLKNCVFDVLLASYVANPAAVMDQKDWAAFAGVDSQKEEQHESNCARFALALQDAWNRFLPVIEAQEQSVLFEHIEMPLAIVLAGMEHTGFRLDADGLTQYSARLEAQLNARMKNIYFLAGKEFNINSPKQLAQLLYTQLELPPLKKNKSGFSTDAETLEKLRPYHPIVNEILEYRLVSKLQSTYAQGLLKVIGQDGRVHTSFNQALTLTGRLSSTEPNLQNIPIKQEEGRELRRFFLPENEDYVLIDADYSQIELRLLAAISGDELMIETFLAGGDIHRTTAAQVFGVAPSDVTPELRKRAKAVNFGIVYGISDFSLAGDIGVSVKEANRYIKGYFEKYPGVDAYLKRTVEEAKANGYVTTLFGRRRYIPELTAQKKPLRSFGERVAMNTPIQGTAADLIKIAMIRTDRALRSAHLDARLILQVHDELVVEAHRKDAQAAAALLKDAMEGVTDLSSQDFPHAKFPVPLAAELSMGANWYDAHG